MPRVVIVGARRRRQGIGPFVARCFIDAAADVCGVVGTSDETARAARDALADYGAPGCSAHVSLARAIDLERPDIVCVCSPYSLHREHLEVIATHSCHCLCEKPLWWGEHPDRAGETARLVDLFIARGRYLGLLAQWPYTLPEFYRLYPDLEGEPVRSFEMHLGPMRPGREMILDSASHPLSMLQRLVGYGTLSDARAEYLDDAGRELCVYFNYLHSRGATKVRCRFTTTERPPRPASYAVNGFAVTRRLELPHYAIHFEAGSRKVRIEDPLRCLVRDFLRRVTSGAPVERNELIGGVVALETLYLVA